MPAESPTPRVPESLRRHLYGSIRASFAASTSATVVVPRSPRLRFVVLLLRMCCLKALPRRNFPFFVRLNRLAAPRCVLSFIFLAINHYVAASLRNRKAHVLCVVCVVHRVVLRRRLPRR